MTIWDLHRDLHSRLSVSVATLNQCIVGTSGSTKTDKTTEPEVICSPGDTQTPSKSYAEAVRTSFPCQ